MGEESKDWVLMVTARSPTNIAVIKYWGKRDDVLILPINDSISVTLHPDHLSTTTTVAVSPSFASDRMWLNGKVLPFFLSFLFVKKNLLFDSILIIPSPNDSFFVGIESMPEYFCVWRRRFRWAGTGIRAV